MQRYFVNRHFQSKILIDTLTIDCQVHFHPSDTNMLVSGSQDGIMKLFDIRSLETVAQFVSNNESVRDVQFNPHSYNQVNGKIDL